MAFINHNYGEIKIDKQLNVYVNSGDSASKEQTQSDDQAQEADDEVVVDAPTTRPNFAFMKHWGHSEEELAAAMESLRVRCQGNNSRSVMRFLVDLDKEGFIDISEVKAAELYEELCRSFGMPNITKAAFAESFRLIG